MRLRCEDLENQPPDRLLPLYLISGDEPLQSGEAADAVRRQARANGFSEREVLEQGPGFDWQSLSNAADSLSLFAERRILELRLSSSKVGADGSQALCRYAERPPEDILLLITCPKLDRRQRNSKWVKALERSGGLVQVWPIEGPQLSSWVERRLRSRGLNPGPEVVTMLAARVEGNLLAAAQEIDKLLLLFGPGSVDADRLLEAVADSARFDVYALVDACLQGKAGRAARILAGLKGEGVAEPVVLWALAREIRVMARIAFEVEGGRSTGQAMATHGVWDKRRPLLQQALRRLGTGDWRALLRSCGRIDRVIKGREAGDSWEALHQLTDRMAGLRALPDAV
jgi:DNA polymerase-3 subunit delta